MANDYDFNRTPNMKFLMTTNLHSFKSKHHLNYNLQNSVIKIKAIFSLFQSDLKKAAIRLRNSESINSIVKKRLTTQHAAKNSPELARLLTSCNFLFSPFDFHKERLPIKKYLIVWLQWKILFIKTQGQFYFVKSQ